MQSLSRFRVCLIVGTVRICISVWPENPCLQHTTIVTEAFWGFVPQVSDSEAVKPLPKRRRILNLSTVVPVPIYSNKVNIRRRRPTPQQLKVMSRCGFSGLDVESSSNHLRLLYLLQTSMSHLHMTQNVAHGSWLSSMEPLVCWLALSQITGSSDSTRPGWGLQKAWFSSRDLSCVP